MQITFINPSGVKNTVELDERGLQALKQLEGYTVLEVPKVRVYTGESVCTSCEG